MSRLACDNGNECRQYSLVNVVVRRGVVQVHSNGVLHVSLVEVWRQVRRRSRVIARVTDVVGTTAREA
jgi:hypothetical protein